MGTEMRLARELPAATIIPSERLQLNEPGKFWVVEQGEADLFLAARGSHGRFGALHYVLHTDVGEALFGFDLAAAPDLALLVVPAPSTRLSAHSTVLVPEESLNGAGAEYARLLDGWIERVTAAIAGATAPKQVVPLEVDQRRAVGEQPELYFAPDGVVWVQPIAGEVRFLDRSTFTAGDLCAVGRRGWIQAQPATRFQTCSTQQLITVNQEQAAVRSFHATVLTELRRHVEQQEQQQCAQLDARDRSDFNALQVALQQLAAPLSKVDRVPTAGGPGSLNHPLLLAMEAIGKRLSVEIKPHPDLLRGLPMKDPVAGVARASGIRTRRVALKANWMRADAGPLLVFRDSDGAPMALLPKTPSAYEVWDPLDRTTRPLTNELVAELNPFAYTFYRPFPPRSISLLDLLAFGTAGCQRELITIAMMGVATGLLGMVTPIATGYIFDSLIPGARRFELLTVCAFLIAFAFSTALFTLARGFAVLRLEGKMDASIQAAIWDRLLALPVPFFREYTSGDLAMRSLGIAQIRQALTGTVLSSVLAGAFSIFSFGLLFYYSWRLAVVATALSVIAGAVALGCGYLQVRQQRRLFELRGRLSGRVLEIISGISKFRVAGAERRAFSLWGGDFAAQKTTALSARKVANGLSVFFSCYPLLALAVIFYCHSALESGSGERALTTGAFLAFLSAFTQTMTAMAAFSSALVSVLMVVPLYERASPIFKTLPEADTAKASPGVLTGRIEISNVLFRYRQDAPLILRDLSLSIEPGEYIAIVGPSGCGKSTLLRLILGFETPESGAVYFDGQDLSGLDVQSVRRQIGVVLQSGSLISGDIFTNIVGASPLTIDDAWEAARMSGLDEDIKRMPMGMHTVINEGGGGLSGGQRQRLLIARAIVNRPRILLFDEATSALDNRTQAVVSGSLKRLQATRVVIAHRLSTIVDADRIVVLHRGEVVQMGSYQSLIHEGGLFGDLAKRQLA